MNTEPLTPAEEDIVWDNALRAVAETSSLDVSQLLERSRLRAIAEARSLLVDIAHAEGLSFSEIGRRMGRTHAAAIFLRRRARALFASDRRFQALAARCNEIYDRLTQAEH